MRTMKEVLFALLWLCFASSFGQESETELAQQCLQSYYETAQTLPGHSESQAIDLRYASAKLPFSCCPESRLCSSDEVGGSCVLHWLREFSIVKCDHFFPGFCPLQQFCGCCVECQAPVCSKCYEDPTANCKTTCAKDEYPITKEVPCHSPFCQCCKKCIPNNECLLAGGTCVAHPSFCTKDGYYPSSKGCSGDCCYCCRPISPDSTLDPIKTAALIN